jgi:hypothetical protein
MLYNKMERFPADILNKFIDELDWKSLVKYCKSNKRIKGLCEGIWKKKMEKEFDKKYWKNSYKDDFLNYLAARNNYLDDILERKLHEYDISLTKLNSIIWKYHNIPLAKERYKELVDEFTKLIDETKEITKILVKYLKRTYPKNFIIGEFSYPNANLDIKILKLKDEGAQKDNIFYEKVTKYESNIYYFIEDNLVEVSNFIPKSFLVFIHNLGFSLNNIDLLYPQYKYQFSLFKMMRPYSVYHKPIDINEIPDEVKKEFEERKLRKEIGDYGIEEEEIEKEELENFD